MVSEGNKTPSINPHTINIIFETYGNGLFTKNALVRQDILQYQIKTKKTEFRFTELGNWLLKNNNEFSSEYDGTSSKKNTPMSTRLANKRERIVARLNELIQLGLIHKKGTTKQQKNKTADVDIYSYTKLGDITAWFVKRLDKDFKQVATDKIYDLTQSLHYAHDSYKNVFQSKFLAKSRENGLYDKLLDKMQELVIPEKNHIIASSYLSLFESVLINIGSFEEISEQYMNTYIDTIKSLSEKAQKVVLLYGKLAVERVVTNITREWEELMLDNISNYSKVTLVADCMLCMQVYPVTVDYIEYLKFRTKSPNDYMTMDCDKCKGNNCLNVAEW